MRRVREQREMVFLVVVLIALAVGLAGWAVAHDMSTTTSRVSWTLGTVIGLVWSTITTAIALRQRRGSVDLIAVLALAGALLVDEPLAGAVVAVMLATGEVLDARAEDRARRDLGLLIERAPQSARLIRTDNGTDAANEVPLTSVERGDRLLVASGEVVPVDGRLLTEALLDESALTGEPLPVTRQSGEEIRSGIVNAAGPFTMTATATAADSTYTALVKLVEQAQASSAPFVRVADRFATLFVPITLLLAGAAWLISGDPVRAVAVLVVATPCPLLIAAPVAIVSGLSRAARLGVIVKGGGALENLADVRTVVFDKTGTLTQGRPTLDTVVTADDTNHAADEVLRLAASLEQVSPHALADSIVSAATRRGMTLTLPIDAVEEHGSGLRGMVEGHFVEVGRSDWVAQGPLPAWARRVRQRAALDTSLTVFVAIDGALSGAFVLDDAIRPDAPRMVRALREAGVDHVVLATGDHNDVADFVGRVVGVDRVLSECSPQEKLVAVADAASRATTLMVGDGINDAPALAAADVGVALAARGATASSEAADIVLTVDRIDALADAVAVARHSKRIAVQAVTVGMGLSGVAMVVAALGWLPPALGAVTQELIDLLAIGLGLRALAPPPLHTVRLAAADVELARRLQTDHDDTQAVVEEIRATADALDSRSPDLAGTRRLVTQLRDVLIPHEREDERLLVPLVARALGSTDSVVATSRTHAEIEHQVGRLGRLLRDLPDDDTVTPDDVIELRRMLYGLYAVLRLHNAQEEELAYSLVPPAG